MGSVGSLGLPRMALLKAKPGLFYRNSGLKTKVPFAALKSEYWEASPCFYFPDLSWALFSSPAIFTPNVSPVPTVCSGMLCVLGSHKPEHIGGVQAELHKAL